MKKHEQTISYLKLYADVTDGGFQNSLGLTISETKAIALLSEQVEEGPDSTPLYVPQLYIESLVHDLNTPYQALKTLYELRERRIILYELCHEIKEPSSLAYEQIVYAPLEEAAERQGVNLKEMLETPSPEVELVGRHYRRIALFNLEYPVVYSCFKEEQSLDKTLEDDVLQELYAGIREERLAEVLEEKFPVMLEFLQYVQSLFSQKLTTTEIEDEKEDSANDHDDLSGSRRLAGGAGQERDSHPVQPASEPNYPVVADPGVGGRSGWQNPQAPPVQGADRHETQDGVHEGHGAPVGIGK